MSDTLVFERYGDGGANRGVWRVTITPDAIHVQFHDDRVYVYNGQKPGCEHVERMKQLAREGVGLSTYISQRLQHGCAYRYWLRPDPSS